MSSSDAPERAAESSAAASSAVDGKAAESSAAASSAVDGKAAESSAAERPAAERPAAEPAGRGPDAPEPVRGAAKHPDSRGPRRARFLERLPDDPELAALAEAFERGNYARVRAGAPRLVEAAEDAAVRDAARDLLRRIEPDPLSKYLLGLAVALLIAVTVFVYTVNGHG